MLKPFDNPIFVTQPLIPEKKKLFKRFEEVIESNWLTNIGKQHIFFEKELANYLKIKNIHLFNNGTIALLIALKALQLPKNSEVITTPFTFAATPHSIVWNSLKPVFADIDKNTMTISVQEIERAITKKTSAVLGVHVYGFPCDVIGISHLAKKYNLKIIYDAAHAFTTQIDQKSICEWGDVSMLSFHATKLFNTIEGGALIYNDADLGKKFYELRNFGIKNIKNQEVIKEGIKTKDFIQEVGINGKMNELQSVWGIETLKIVKKEQEDRENVRKIYISELSSIDQISIPRMPKNITNSYQYFPVSIYPKKKLSRDYLYNELLKYNIYCRKYFYPLCSEFECYKNLSSAKKKNLPISYQVANNILCLPFYGALLKHGTIQKICKIIRHIIP